MMTFQDDYYSKLLVFIALSYLGVYEIGNNRGPMVEKFQKAVNPNPTGEAWCMDFVIYCIERVKEYASAIDDGFIEYPTISQNESVLHVVEAYKQDNKIKKAPSKGDIAVWHRGKGNVFGHAGIVTSLFHGGFSAIEGNTFNKGRTRQGVYHHVHNFKNKNLIGFLTPFKRYG